MKLAPFLILIAFLFVSCQKQDQRVIQTRLLSEAPVFTQKERRTPPYQIEMCGPKLRPCLIQEGNISSDFLIRLKQDPVLQYKLSKSPGLIAGVVVESDFPSRIRDEYSAVPGSFQEIDLKKFEERVTRIRFFVKSPANGSAQWIDPLILQRDDRVVASDSKELKNLRARHKTDNVLLIVLDAAGVSHFGYSGYPSDTTPIIDSLARDGVFWDHAVSQSASTVSSTGTLLTGLYPAEHKTLLSNHSLKERFQTLAEYFRAYGYRTALFSGNPNASSMTGYGQGFEHLWQPHTGNPVNAADFVSPVNDWVDSHKNQKLFAYMHLREPHSPFEPPRDLWKKMDPQTNFVLPGFVMHEIPDPRVLKQIVAAYDANLASADRELGKIFDHLKRIGLWEDFVIIVLADHGEAFWEHGKQGHNYPLYEEILRIPFIIRIPREHSIAGKRISSPVGSVDILPTLVDLFQFSRRGGHWSGISLLPSIYQGGTMAERLMISQTVRRKIYSCRWRNLKYIWHKEDGINENELYDLNQDPHEKQNLIKNFPIVAAYLHQELAKYLHQSYTFEKPGRTNAEKRPQIDEQIKEELRALGYVD